MKEELIKIETVKLGEEKGFNYNPEYYFYPNDNRDGYNIIHKNHCFGGNTLKIEEHYLNGDYSLVIPAPTQSLLQRWLREVHKIDVYFAIIGTSGSDRYYFQISMKKGSGKYEWISTLNSNATVYKTPERALEVGLQESLKLI